MRFVKRIVEEAGGKVAFELSHGTCRFRSVLGMEYTWYATNQISHNMAGQVLLTDAPDLVALVQDDLADLVTWEEEHWI